MAKLPTIIYGVILLVTISINISVAQDEEIDIDNIGVFAYDLSDKQLIDLLKKSLETDSTSTKNWQMLGRIWENRMQFDSALVAYNNAIAVDSSCIKCKQDKARVLASLGKNTSALRLYQKILKNDTTNVSVRSQYARMLRKDGQFAKAFHQFDYLLLADSLNSYLWEQLGDCAMRIDSIAIGLKAYNKSFELNPANMPLAIKLINGFIKVEVPPMFIMPFADIAHKQDSTYVPIIRTKGYLYFLSEGYHEAEEWLEKSNALGDSSRFTHKFLGISKYHVGKYLSATEILEKAFAKDTSDNVLNYVMANSYIQIGDWPRAVELLDLTEELITPDPKEVAILYAARGEAYKKSSQYIMAIEQFEKALERHPEYKAYLFDIGQCYYSIKNYEKAKKVFEELQLFAEDESALRSTKERASMANYFIRQINGEIFFLDGTNAKDIQSTK
jgi:tetratricopeptide (TPR) repeat protein